MKLGIPYFYFQNSLILNMGVTNLILGVPYSNIMNSSFYFYELRGPLFQNRIYKDIIFKIIISSYILIHLLYIIFLNIFFEFFMNISFLFYFFLYY